MRKHRPGWLQIQRIDGKPGRIVVRNVRKRQSHEHATDKNNGLLAVVM
jgi:hypothetical protein